MSLVFSSLYDLALELLTAPSESPLHKWTAHHFESREDAERILRASILKDTMPGESNQTDWGITRIFLFNLINRAQAPMSWGNLSNILKEVESDCVEEDTPARQSLLMDRLAKNAKLHSSLSAFLNPQRAPNGTKTYTEWLRGLINSYGQMSVDQLEPANVLGNIHAIAKDPSTRIPNMGIPLAANLLADLGIKSSVKPDLHVRPTIRGLMGNSRLSDAAIIRSVIVMAQEETDQLRAMPDYAWINEAGGLYPRHIDRLIYLIGSDNFLLNGRKNRLRAPQRRQWMLNSLTTR